MGAACKWRFVGVGGCRYERRLEAEALAGRAQGCAWYYFERFDKGTGWVDVRPATPGARRDGQRQGVRAFCPTEDRTIQPDSGTAWLPIFRKRGRLAVTFSKSSRRELR